MPASREFDPIVARLRERLSAAHLRLRLGIEQDRERRVFGQGRNFFHIENWYSVHGLIRGLLRASLLYERGRRNALNIRVREHTVHLQGLPEAFDGLRVLQLSDLHLDMTPDFPNVLGRVVRDLDYDLCVMTGDYRGKTFGPIEETLDGLERLRTQLREPVYAVLGNHDSVRLVPDMEDLGIRVLLNESISIERAGARIYLAGIDDPHYFRADNLEKASTDIPEDQVSVLLAHSPEIYRNAAHAGFDLMLCGHTHGGQICLPGGVAVMCNADAPRRYCAGPWRYHDLRGYTSVGAGSSVVHVRLNCPPEVTVHILRRGLEAA